ncbi:hypothetical protein SPLC1_S207670 [Arthrospira platensis C1]|nr:hypothetical protein SPLC1_S207670 [Arthrospira platensis C1]
MSDVLKLVQPYQFPRQGTETLSPRSWLGSLGSR